MEFVLANIWLWYCRETHWFDRLTGFAAATGFILISFQMIVCFIGMRRGGDVVRYFLVVAIALACVIPACLVARFVVRREFRLFTKYRTDSSMTRKQLLFCRIVNFLTAAGIIGAWWHFEQRLGILEKYASRIIDMDSLAEALPLPHIMAIIIVLVLASFLTFTLLAMRRWTFFFSWLVSTFIMTFAGYPVWRSGRIFFSAGSRGGSCPVRPGCDWDRGACGCRGEKNPRPRWTTGRRHPGFREGHIRDWPNTPGIPAMNSLCRKTAGRRH